MFLMVLVLVLILYYEPDNLHGLKLYDEPYRDVLDSFRGVGVGTIGIGTIDIKTHMTILRPDLK